MNPNWNPNINQAMNQNMNPNINPTMNQNVNPNANQTMDQNINQTMNQNINPNINPNQNEHPNIGQNWMNNPSLGNIDPSKLQMLASLAEQAQGKNQNELLSFLMSASAQSRGNNLNFNAAETDAIINVLKIGKSQQEIQKIDRICALMKSVGRKFP